MNMFESQNEFPPKGAQPKYRSELTAAGARLMAEATSGLRHAEKFIKPVPFSGLLTNKLLTALPGEDFARLLTYLEPVMLSGGEDLCRDGEEIFYAYFPETAIISHLYFMADGSMTATSVIGRDGMVGISTIFDSGLPSYWTRVTIGGSALRVETEFIKSEFARGGAMQSLLLGYVSTRLAQLSQRAVCNGRHTLSQRLCTWLLMIHDRAGEENLPLTHEEIAHHLGTRRAGVSTSSNALRESGAIDYKRGILRILDRQRLEEAACECYRALRQAVENPLSRK